MSTLNELKATIASDLHRDDLGTLIADEINRAIMYYGGERFWFLEGISTLITIANQQYYDVPTDYERFDNMNITISGSKVPISLISYTEIDEKDTGLTTGIPSEVSYYASLFRFYPIPNAAYTITFSYQKSLAAPVDADTNAWTTEAFDLIRHRVLKRIYKTRLRNKEAALFAESDEIMEYNALISESTQMSTTGKIRRSGW